MVSALERGQRRGEMYIDSFILLTDAIDTHCVTGFVKPDSPLQPPARMIVELLLDHLH